MALFSLEMSESELAQRFIASQASIKGDDLRKGRVPASRWGKIMEASNRLAKSPLFIDDSSDLSVLDVRAKARRLLQQHPDGLGLIVIDYLQLMRGDGRTDNRVEQIGQISRGLKTLARELECPVVALSQLNRGVEQRTDKRPVLSDLRESGSIEQDADLVMFIYRDEYYDKESEREGIADLIISKHRNGGLGTVELTFQKEYPRFMSYVGDTDRVLGVSRRMRRRHPAPRERLPDGHCDGSGFLYDEAARVARPCSCRPLRIARKKAAALEGRIPKRYREVSFDREPLRSIERSNPHVVREVRQYVGAIAEQLDAGRGLWFTGDVGTGKTTLAMLDLQGRDGGRPHGGDLLAAAAARPAARHVRRHGAVLAQRADRPARRGRPAPRRRRRRGADHAVGARAALHRSSTRATRRARRSSSRRT